MVHLSFAFRISETSCLSFLAGRQSLLAVGRHSLEYMCEYDTSTASVWAAPYNKSILSKRTETSLHERFLKINLADVGMSQCMNALADKVHKTSSTMHTVICTQQHGHIIQQPSLCK